LIDGAVHVPGDEVEDAECHREKTNPDDVAAGKEMNG